MRARRVYRLSIFILSSASIVNIVVAVRVMFALRNPVNYNFRIIEPPVFTNVTSSAVSFSRSIPGEPVDRVSDLSTNSAQLASFTNLQVQVAVESYHYMRIGGFPCMRLNGLNYSIGDRTAYGVISAIFPERVYLENSGYISNSRRVFDVDPVYLRPAFGQLSSQPNDSSQPREKFHHDERADNS